MILGATPKHQIYNKNKSMEGLFNDDYIIKPDNGVFYLDDVFRHDRYMHIYSEMLNTRHNRISVLNKGMCGNGGTTGFIRYATQNSKALLILVPYVSICRSKEDTDIMCVYGGSDGFNRNAQIVVATYDQFHKLIKELNMSGGMCGDMWSNSFWSGRTIIIDEYDKILDESGFRDVCVRITDMITKTDTPVVLMSATCDDDYISLLRKILPEREIYRYTVEYNNDHFDYNTRIQVWDTKQKDIVNILHTMLEKTDGHICVFYNSVADIRKILDKISDTRCEIMCSSTRMNDVGGYYSDKFNEKKKLHFMTSAYFVGHDINTHISKVVIVGSCEFSNMCISPDDIKQIIGRFRYDISVSQVRKNDIHLFYVQKKKDKDNYLKYYDDFERINKHKEEFIDILSDEQLHKYTFYSRDMLDYYRTKNILDNFKMWESIDNVVKSLKEYGYIVKKMGPVTGMIDTGKKKHLTFKQAKKKLLEGKTVLFDEYPDINELAMFMSVKGKSALKDDHNTKSAIHNWYKIYIRQKGNELDLESDKLPEMLGLCNFGRYTAKYLIACLDYIGVKSDYDRLSIDCYDHLGVYAVIWKKGHNLQDCTYIVTYGVAPKNDTFFSSLLYNKNNKKCDDFRNNSKMTDCYEKPYFSYRTGIENKKVMSKRVTLNELMYGGILADMTQYDIYNYVIADKTNRLPDVKKTDKWRSIKVFCQSQISEMYSCDERYRFKNSSVNLADTLILDIDGGMRFSEFREKYGRWKWFAYPTISNTDYDWIKFRVVVFLDHTIDFTNGEYNLQVLKLIRSYFCPYEDPNHQLFSLININDFIDVRYNDGEYLDISQEFVDNLYISVKNSKEYIKKKFNIVEVNDNMERCAMSLESAKNYFNESFSKPDGSRHNSLYVIKNNLDKKYWDDFKDWLASEHNQSYVTKFNSHTSMIYGK